MAEYRLQPGEAFVHRTDRVWADGGDIDELILTSKHLVLLLTESKGWLSSEQVAEPLPLKKIKVFQGHAQALVSKGSNGRPGLDVYFENGTFHFRFESKREAAFWSQKIDEVVTGTPATMVSPDAPAAEQVTQAVKDTVGALRDIISSKSKTATSAAVAVAALPVAGDCTSCGAPISGMSDKVIVCSYCDTPNRL